MIILHITTRAAWDAAAAADGYQPASLASEGFLHCSTPAQTVATANKYFRGRTDLILLCIDDARLIPELRHEAPFGLVEEDPRAREQFPHIYGALNLDAVIRTIPFPSARDGSFALPSELAPES